MEKTEGQVGYTRPSLGLHLKNPKNKTKRKLWRVLCFYVFWLRTECEGCIRFCVSHGTEHDVMVNTPAMASCFPFSDFVVVFLTQH